MLELEYTCRHSVHWSSLNPWRTSAPAPSRPEPSTIVACWLEWYRGHDTEKFPLTVTRGAPDTANACQALLMVRLNECSDCVQTFEANAHANATSEP